jgi:thiamine-monophosphate kinase
MPLSGEDRLLHWLRQRSGSKLIGDDAAILPESGPFAVTVDSQIEGVHFTPGLGPVRLAWRLLAVNLSDLAATGAEPAYAFLALSTAPGFDHRRFFNSLLSGCRRYGLELAGGDLARSGQTVATLTLLGTKPPEGRWLRRSDAAPGHGLWLGGTIGESAAGRRLIDRGEPLKKPASLRAAAHRAIERHLVPMPQIELGRWLGQQKAGAAMDVSDGLARDLHRLCRESSTGARIEAEALPFSDRFAELCRAIGADPLALAVSGGEDYVLLFTLPSGVEPPAGFGCRRIGTITKSRRVLLLREGIAEDLPARGWDHLT